MEESLTEDDPGRSFTITRRNGDVYTVTVSVEDYDRVVAAGPWSIYVSKTSLHPYAQHAALNLHGRHTMETLHHFILGRTPGLEVDHRNGNGLDCRRSNLRQASHSQNMKNRGRQSRNKSGRKGVCWHSQKRRWQAQISSDGRAYHLGYFSDIEEAAAAYREAASRLHKEFARFE